MIFGNGLKKFDFARQNLDGRAKCLAQKNEKKTLYTHLKNRRNHSQKMNNSLVDPGRKKVSPSPTVDLLGGTKGFISSARTSAASAKLGAFDSGHE